MKSESNIIGLSAWPTHPLAEAARFPGRSASRLTDLLRARPALKTRDLIAALLGIGARARRASMPKVAVRVRVHTPDGRLAVRIRLP